MLSKNAVGIIVLFLSFIGVEVSESYAMDVVTSISTIYGFVMLLWNQVMREDVENFLWKTKKLEDEFGVE